MLPKTRAGEKKHRRQKRQLEVSLALERIRIFLNGNSANRHVRILEFGSGEGFQVRFLQRLGDVVASDIRVSEEIRGMSGVEFIRCDITRAPFREEQFDLVFANHVIEHVVDLRTAFAELKRIGKPQCIYAFCVPTSIWLLLSIPASYFNRVRSLVIRLQTRHSGTSVHEESRGDRSPPSSRVSAIRDLFSKLSPDGHGAHQCFVECYHSMRIKAWERLFLQNGFSIIEMKPLLLYGASEWPVVPTTRVFSRFGICSSLLFLVTRADAGA